MRKNRALAPLLSNRHFIAKIRPCAHSEPPAVTSSQASAPLWQAPGLQFATVAIRTQRGRRLQQLG